MVGTLCMYRHCCAVFPVRAELRHYNEHKLWTTANTMVELPAVCWRAAYRKMMHVKLLASSSSLIQLLLAEKSCCSPARMGSIVKVFVAMT